MIEFTAHRHAMRKPGDLDVETGEAVGDVMGGCLPFHRRIDGDDELANAAGAHTVDQALDVQVLGPDPVERRQRAPQHVIGSVHRTRPLQRPEIRHIFHHDDDRLVAPVVGADGAGVYRIDVAAAGADLHLVIGLAHGMAQRPEKLFLLLDEMQCCPSRRAGPKSRHFCQELDQFFDFGAGDSFCHERFLLHKSGNGNHEAQRVVHENQGGVPGRGEKAAGKDHEDGHLQTRRAGSRHGRCGRHRQ